MYFLGIKCTHVHFQPRKSLLKWKALKCKPSAQLHMHVSKPANIKLVRAHCNASFVSAWVFSAEKWPPVYMAVDGGSVDLRNKAVSEKILKIFWPSLPVEYVILISGRTDAPEVRSGWTDRQIDKPNYRNPRCACAPKVNGAIRLHMHMVRHSVVWLVQTLVIQY